MITENDIVEEEFKAGDVVQYDDGKMDYLIKIEGDDGLFINACNPSFIERGLRYFGQELYPFTYDCRQLVIVCGHYKDGSVDSAISWFAENKEFYKG